LKSVLVIGGSGTFGARIVKLLHAAGGFHLVIGGRNMARAEALRSSLPGGSVDCRLFDRKGDVPAQLMALAPWAVIDAAGPFQDSSSTRYAVPEACTRLGIHYIDLADARDFVAGIGALDKQARAAGVAILSGASSVPALSMAVVEALRDGLATIVEIDTALSSSNRATAGPNVNAAILSYVGRPIRFRHADSWQIGHGWQHLTKNDFTMTGRLALPARWVGLCDVPDLDLLPQRFPEVSSVIFRAGAELPLQNFVLWALSYAVRWGCLPPLARFAPLFNRLQGWSGFLGTDRSAMSVRITGRDAAGRGRQHLWTLLAEDGHGPWVPSFAAVLLVQKLAAGNISAGAMAAGGLLTLEDFAPLFAQFHLFTEITRQSLPQALYARVLGDDFAALPAPIAAIHDFVASGAAHGRGSVARGSDPVARLLGWAFRFPPAADDVPVTVTFDIKGDCETWRRQFGAYRFASRLRQRRVGSRDILTETFWPFTFDFDLTANADGLDMMIRGWRFLGVKLPRALAPRVQATERVDQGRFTFDVRIALPWGPLIVHYRGWLALSQTA
jgi:NAD(P)-dependent dehydrogenase (short-subunit alcohol dehydrogenase family)